MRPLRLGLVIPAAVAFASLGGCDDPQDGWQPAENEFRGFQEVYPVLMRDCAFPACHGDSERAFHIYGPGRARLTDDVRSLDALTGDELVLSYTVTLSMIDPEHPERSLLLKKPLAIEAGGSAHGGIDDFGRNVYRTKDDEGYKTLEKWVLSKPEPVEDE